MTEQLQSKKQIWRKVHAERTQCPKCGRHVTLRCLRWRHACTTEQQAPIKLLTPDLAEERRREVRQRAMEALKARFGEGPSGPATTA